MPQFAGDNYVAVASGSPSFLGQLRNRDELDAFRVVDPNVGDGAAGQILDMITAQGGYMSNDLTVWRLAHVEADSMLAPTPSEDDADGFIERLTGAGKTVVIVAGDGTLTSDFYVNGDPVIDLRRDATGVYDSSGGNGRFENGLIASLAGVHRIQDRLGRSQPDVYHDRCGDDSLHHRR